MKLLYPTPSAGEESSVALRRHVEAQALAADNVLGSRGGIILMQGAEMGSILSLYFISCPCEEPRVYTSVGYIIPPIHCKESKNTYGQFGVLPDAGDSGMSFFVKDSCNGVTVHMQAQYFSQMKAFPSTCPSSQLTVRGLAMFLNLSPLTEMLCFTAIHTVFLRGESFT
jgi:hypothetical protein